MDNEDRLHMLIDKFTHEKTGDEVDGITIIIDGKIKEVLDGIMNSNPDKYDGYPEVLRDVIFAGISDLLQVEE